MAIFKIIFLTLINDVKDPSLGFIVKDISKAEALNDMEDVKCLGVSFSSSIPTDYHYSKSFLVKKIIEQKRKRFFSNFFEDRYLYNQIDIFLSTQSFDVILFRYNIASRSLFKLVKKYKAKFVFEHNTFEETEHAILIKERFKRLRFSIKPGFFLYHFEGRIWPLFCERFYGNKIRALALGGISVTQEIAAYQESRVKGYQNAVITNGVKYETNSLVKQNTLIKELNTFMLLGTGANWHGVDRVIKGIHKYRGKYKINFDIIGYTLKEDQELIKKYELEGNVKFLPAIANSQLSEILGNYHISFGTLGLHRKKLNEASPLKVRESLMRGFPVVIGYNDTDITNVEELKDFVCQVPANDEALNLDVIADFAETILSKPNYPSYVSNTSKPYIDYKFKAKAIVNFLKKLTDGS